MDSILVALQQPFFLRSVLVVVILMMVFPLYGNIVIVRQEANIVHTFAYICLLGVACGLWFDRPTQRAILGGVVTTVIFLSASSVQGGATQVTHNEVGAQLGLVGAILLVSQMSGYRADISSYLFGDILLLGQQDVFLVIGIAAVTWLLYMMYGKQRYAISLHQSLAQSKNIPAKFLSFLYLVALGLLIGGAMKIIGVLLVSAFLILPSTITKTRVSNKTQRNRISMVVGLLLSICALFLSWHRDLPSGATIVGVMIAVYLMTELTKKMCG